MRKFLTVFLLFSLIFIPRTGIAAQENRGIPLQVKTQNGATVAQFGEAHALVIGESDYNNGWRRLPGVKDDVKAVQLLFEELGFHVETIQNARSRALMSGITDFLDRYGYIRDARLILYFAGHGYTLTLGTNNKMGYIVPVDAPFPELNETAFKQSAIPMDQFYSWSRTYDARHILFIFDSCYSGTIFRSRDDTPPPPLDRLIAQPVRQFITSGAANEGVPDESIFRRELEAALRFGLADTMKTGYVSGTELGNYLNSKVSAYTNGKQNPQFGKLNDPNLDKGDFVFAVGSEPIKPPPPPAPTPTEMALINGGSFSMGSPNKEKGRLYYEGPARKVTLGSFYLGKNEVTQKEYLEIMGTNPSGFKGDNLPVEQVSWYEAVEYCNERSLREGLTPVYTITKNRNDPNNRNNREKDSVRWLVTWNREADGYRLPSEAEWEYACRAETVSAYNTGAEINETTGWYAGNSGGETHPVGQKPPNAWGLHDMHGNVWEWCWDWFGYYSKGAHANPDRAGGSFRVYRGGCWNCPEQNLRSAYRGQLHGIPSNKNSVIGFRIARNAE